MNATFLNARMNFHLAIKTLSCRTLTVVSSVLTIAKKFFSRAYYLTSEHYNNSNLHERAWEGRPVGDLLKKNTNIDARDRGGQTPLFQTAWNGKPLITTELLNNGAKVDAEDRHGCQAIHAAALRDDTEVLEALIKGNANPNAINHLGQSPLSWAAYTGNEKSIEFLLENEANLFHEDEKGKNALHCAAEGGKTNVCFVLNKKGISWDAVDLFGNTALHYAYLYGHMPLVKKLINAGIDQTIRNQAGNKPEDLKGLGGLNSRIRICWYNMKNVFIFFSSSHTPPLPNRAKER